ncbi:AAA family ATPase [Desulfobacterales bacterium HSG16]|nr:AAA family ATPase [Desulfobacterales bacterium HSG16]
MPDDELKVLSFKPIFLTVDGVGPFQDQPYEVDFTDEQDISCNLFLFMSENGRGKTTLLDLMARLMNLLGEKSPDLFGHEDLDTGRGRAQWDVCVTLNRQGRDETIILSILAGNLSKNAVLKIWQDRDLKKYTASSWHRTGFRRHVKGFLETVGAEDDLVKELMAVIRGSTGEPPQDFASTSTSLPALLYFTSYRDIPLIKSARRTISEPEQWGYQPVYFFNAQGKQWSYSLDNLFVWLKWLDDGRFEKAVEFVNERVFKGSTKFIKSIRRQPPEVVVANGDQTHRLDRLSSGEKNLTEMFFQIGTHMTRCTIVLIDEANVHLHPRWQHRLMKLFRMLVKNYPGITIIAASHSLAMLEAFGFEVPEDGIRKGGEIIKEGLE